MSRKKHIHQQINNSMTDLISGLNFAATTGGSQLSSYGTVGFSTNYALITLNRIILTYFYSGNGIFQTACQLPIQDALAKRIEIESGELAPEDIDAIMDWFEDTGAWQALEDFWTWVRVYGGAGLIINTNQDPETPLNLRRLKGSPIELYDVDRWQLSLATGGVNTIDGYFDMTKADSLYLNGQKIDSSRIIFGTGKRAPSFIRRMLLGWGMSEAERMLRDLNNYLKTGDVLYEILDESKLDIYKMEGLANKLATRGGTDDIQRRIQQANEIKNYTNALIMDMKDDYEQKTLTFSGLADVMRENRIGVAAALRMPMTKLFGLSASGFSTGEADNDNYNEMIESEIRAKMRPAIRKMIEIACANLFGYVPSFRFEFPSLKVVSQLEAAQINESKINGILSLYDRGLITDGKKIGDELAGSDAISTELAAAFNETPSAPNGSDAIATPANDTISVYRKAVDVAKTTANAVKNMAARVIGR